jgi:hypothetical protein
VPSIGYVAHKKHSVNFAGRFLEFISNEIDQGLHRLILRPTLTAKVKIRKVKPFHISLRLREV